MKDRDFLLWVWYRMRNVYGESGNVDYMLKLKSIIEATDPAKVTPNTALSTREIRGNSANFIILDEITTP